MGEFLAEIKKEFGGGNEESIKVAELKRIEQEERTIEEFVQDFKRIARGSRYKECLLIKEFKRSINGSIRRKLMEAESQLTVIRRECGQTLGRVRVRTVVIISLQRT